MSYKVELSDNFKKEAKNLPKNTLRLKQNSPNCLPNSNKLPQQALPLVMIFRKIRLSIASKNKGNSGGVRVMSFVKVTSTTVLLFSIYNKGAILPGYITC